MTNDELTEEQLDRRRFWRRIRRFVLYPLLCLVLLVVFPVVWMILRNAAAQKQVDAQIANWRSQDLPYDNASLSAYHDRLTKTKDLSEWLAVLTAVDSDEFKQASNDLYPWNETAGPSESRVLLEEWDDLLKTAQRLAQADIKRRMPLEVDGINTRLDWSNRVRQLSKLFQLQAADAIERRESHDTCDAILNLLGSARSVEGQPFIIGQLIAVAVESVAIEQLQHAIEQNVLNADDLKRVRERLEARTPWQTKWQVGLVGERAMLLPAFAEPDRYLGDDAHPFSLPLPWRAHDELNFIEITSKSVELPTQDLNEFRYANQELSAELDKFFRKGNWTTQLDNTITNLVLPAYGAYGEAIVQREMRCRLAILGIGVREYQAKFEKLPDSLDDLKQVGVDAAQQKPPGTKPFGFRKLDSSVALWGFQSRTIDSTPDDPPDTSDQSHQWDRMWHWQIDK